jgi:hypothetical protein
MSPPRGKGHDEMLIVVIVGLYLEAEDDISQPAHHPFPFQTFVDMLP